MRRVLAACVSVGCVMAFGGLLTGAPEKAKTNETCPVSGKPVVEDAALEINGGEVHFCCKSCVRSFKDKQLAAVKAKSECPVSKKATDPATSLLHAEVVYFCCKNCQDKFTAREKLQADVPANKTCPIGGKPVNEKAFLNVNGHKVYFCSSGCVQKYKKNILRVVDKGAKECPISGKPARASVSQIHVKEVQFCCTNCRGKYAREHFSAAKKS